MSKKHPPQQLLHVPVLLEQTLKLLNPKKGESFLDLTAGYGGHASQILKKTGNYAESVLVDRDDNAIKYLKSLSDQGVRLMHTDFVNAAKQLTTEGKQFNIVLIDLGVSSPQLDQSERGFSFTNSGPLDMRMDQRQEINASVLVNTASVSEIAHIINKYGEEPVKMANKIAKLIVNHRPLNNTKELADLIKQNYRGRSNKIHPATRTFQALRIVINDELSQIENILPYLPKLLNSGGRVGIISFHSLEDRIVKRYLKEQFEAGYEAIFEPITKKPITGSKYDVNNPRARSSKLRVAIKK